LLALNDAIDFCAPRTYFQIGGLGHAVAGSGAKCSGSICVTSDATIARVVDPFRDATNVKPGAFGRRFSPAAIGADRPFAERHGRGAAGDERRWVGVPRRDTSARGGWSVR
jgi:hypothetical protein